jgi:uncharacterized protein YndB with AHSA1/START domain
MENKTQIIAEKGKQELFIVRKFDADRELLFKAFSEPDLIVQWMGPTDLDMKIEKLDNQSHGSYRYIHSDKNGNNYGFNGAIHEVAFPERIIRTFEFEGMPEKGHVALEFVTFEKLNDNSTKLVAQTVFKSVADRDGMIQSGMEAGVVDSYNKLDVLLKTKL